MIYERNLFPLILLCFYYSFSNAENINLYEVLSTETVPKLPKEIEDAVPDLNERNISPNTTINVHNGLEILNITSQNNTIKTVNCLPNMGSEQVEIVNFERDKILRIDEKVTSIDIPAQCLLVMFYSKYSTFSSMAAPYFNALARAFPDIKMLATDVPMYHFFKTQNGLVGIPSVILLHNSIPFARFTDSEYTLERFSKFVTKYTGIEAKEKSIVTSADFAGPVVSFPSQDSDIFCALAYLFVLFCGAYYFMKSSWWRWILETIQNNWREAEAQAEHLHDD